MTHQKESPKINFASKLKEYRKLKGLSQQEAATILGKHQSFISRTENGLRKITIDDLALFEKVYGITMEELFRAE